MKRVLWGILSTALIGTGRVIPGMLKSKTLEIAAIASRSLPKAVDAAAALGIPNAYGSYEALLADSSVEAIYNPLPNHLHVPMTLAAAQAGKHVLCEKPMSLTAPELEVLRPYASRVHMREAFMVRFHPQWIQAREQGAAAHCTLPGLSRWARILAHERFDLLEKIALEMVKANGLKLPPKLNIVMPDV